MSRHLFHSDILRMMLLDNSLCPKDSTMHKTRNIVSKYNFCHCNLSENYRYKDLCYSMLLIGNSIDHDSMSCCNHVRNHSMHHSKDQSPKRYYINTHFPQMDTQRERYLNHTEVDFLSSPGDHRQGQPRRFEYVAMETNISSL